MWRKNLLMEFLLLLLSPETEPLSILPVATIWLCVLDSRFSRSTSERRGRFGVSWNILILEIKLNLNYALIMMSTHLFCQFKQWSVCQRYRRSWRRRTAGQICGNTFFAIPIRCHWRLTAQTQAWTQQVGNWGNRVCVKLAVSHRKRLAVQLKFDTSSIWQLVWHSIDHLTC